MPTEPVCVNCSWNLGSHTALKKFNERQLVIPEVFKQVFHLSGRPAKKGEKDVYPYTLATCPGFKKATEPAGTT